MWLVLTDESDCVIARVKEVKERRQFSIFSSYSSKEWWRQKMEEVHVPESSGKLPSKLTGQLHEWEISVLSYASETLRFLFY